jgi:hypothetical protein
MKIVKKVLKVLGVLVLIAAVGIGIFVYTQTSAFDASMDKVYDVPLPTVTRSEDPAVLARGKHLAEAVWPCAASKCHGSDLAGGETIAFGPLATLTGPNITGAGLGAAYNDAELARLVKHGIKKDGRSLRFMPTQDMSWIPDSDVVAIVSYLRTVPNVDKPNGPCVVKTLGKVLDRREQVELDVARRIDHAKNEAVPAPEPTANYGRFLARLCTGCHGQHFSGGKMPGAPPEFPIPANITFDPSGLAGWTYEDFDKLLTTGVKKNGKNLDKFMPIEAFGKMDDTEKHAIYEYLKTVPQTAFGNR